MATATIIGPDAAPAGGPLAEAAVAIGQALEAAFFARLGVDHTGPLRQALEHVIEAANEAGGQQLEIERLTRYADRILEANSALTRKQEQLQERAERMVMSLAPALDVVNQAFLDAGMLKQAAAPSSCPPDITRRGRVSDDTLEAVRTAPDMAHHGD